MTNSRALVLIVSALLGLIAGRGIYQSAHPATAVAATQPTDLETVPPAPPAKPVVASATSIPLDQPPDIAALLEQLRANADPDLRAEAIQKFANSVAISDLRPTLQSLGEDSDHSATDLRTGLVRRWAQEDPMTARQWALEQPLGPIRKLALEQVTIADSDRDFSEAAAWVMALPNGQDEQAAKIAFGYEAARKDPVQALDVASTLPPTPQRDELLVHAAGQWSSIDFSNAVSWALTLPDPQLRDRLVSAVAIGAADQDPAAAATVAAQAIAPGQQQDRAVVSIVQRWAEKSPEETAAWVAQFPEAPLRDAAMQQVVTAWAGQNPNAAETWVDSLPAGGPHEKALAAYEQAVASHGPASSGVIRDIGE
jgi:hypothetical protein